MQKNCFFILIVFFLNFNIAKSMDSLCARHADRGNSNNFEILPTWQEEASYNVSFGYVGRAGDQDSMDEVGMLDLITDGNCCLDDCRAALFDGHNGSGAAHYAAHCLFRYLDKYQCGNDDEFITAYRESFTRINLEILKNRDIAQQGTSASIIHINKLHAVIGWVGNSRVVIVRDGKVIASTTDHVLTNDFERARVEERGGEIINTDCARIEDLTLSRVLGNINVKPYLISVPQVLTCDLEYNDLVIIASEGVWNVITSERAAALVRCSLHESAERIDNKYPQIPTRRDTRKEVVFQDSSDDQLLRAARVLRDQAYCLGSKQNISAIILKIESLNC